MQTRYDKRADGLGVWVAFEQSLPSLAEVCAELRELGVKWVAPRAGDYGKMSLSAKRFEEWRAACEAESLGLFPWYYSRPQFYEREVNQAIALFRMGATGVIVDAEIEWANKHAEADRYGRLMRDAIGDEYIAHAPLAWLSYHPSWPFKEFGLWVDQVHPQTYWTELKRGRYDECEKGCFDPWEALSAAGDPRAHGYAPIGVTYGSKELARAGGPPCPGEFKPADLDAFLRRYDGAETLSLYSWELAGDEVRAALRARVARLAPPVGPTPSETLHGTHVVDASIAEYQRDFDSEKD